MDDKKSFFQKTYKYINGDKLTGIPMIDNIFKEEDSIESSELIQSVEYNYPTIEFEDSETVNESLTGKPYIDAIITIIISIFLIILISGTFYFLTKLI